MAFDSGSNTILPNSKQGHRLQEYSVKKKSFLLMKVGVGLTIFIGILLVLIANKISFTKIAEDDIENISKLSASTIYAEIDSSLTKPIFVGQTIANDLFLKNWLSAEADSGGNARQIALIQQYLSDYSEKYGYNSVFVVSEKSGFYYYQGGINKVVSPDDTHDIWYYDFIKSTEPYKLNVDTDEANGNELTVFVDSKIMDSGGTLLGVAGVGIKMSHLQALLLDYELEYDLKALLIDEQGLVQVDSVVENIETANFFNNSKTNSLKTSILENKTDMEIFWYPGDGSDHCLITKFVENLNWYIVIEKNTSYTQKLLTAQINRDLLYVSIIIALVLLMISYIIGKYNRVLLRTASIDDVTNLPNYKMFQEIFSRNTKRPACRQGTVFVFDIDHFKKVNDHFGHLFGNTVLYRVSETAKNAVGNKGVVARWGGDEFLGVIYGSPEAAEEILRNIVKDVAAMQEGGLESITISLGAVSIPSVGGLNTILREADAAMYTSKESGRNQYTYL